MDNSNNPVKDSRCFGVAYDGTVKECKICEVAKLCKQRTEDDERRATPSKPNPAKKSDISTSDESVSTMKPSNPRPDPSSKDSSSSKPSTKASAKKESPKKDSSDKKYSDDMPDFKPMSIEDLVELAESRGLNPSDFDKFTNTSIKKMRITMALKKTYEA